MISIWLHLQNDRKTRKKLQKFESDLAKFSPLLGFRSVFGTPSWNRFDFRLTYDINTKTKVGTDIHNLFDVHYKEFASGISAPGRSLRLRLQYRF